MTLYRRTQIGGVIIGGLVAAILVVVAICILTHWHPIPLSVALALATSLALFYSLTVEIGERELRCYFGPGLIKRTFPLGSIESAAAVRNRWYYGWGIRLTPYGWMFNVSGLDAVELRLKSGKRFRIGTDAPQEVAERIRQALATRV